MSFLPIFQTTVDALQSDNLEIRQGLRQAEGIPGISIANFLTVEECKEILDGVYILQPYWRRGTCHGEFTLGRAWYTSIDNREVMDYFEEAPILNQLLQQTFPNLFSKISDFCKKLVNNQNVIYRPGWAGPGIVVFSAHCTTAEMGGSCHIDYEGLSRRHLDTPEGAEIFSFMLPLSLPKQAGNLRVWPDVYQRFHHSCYLQEIGDPAGEYTIMPYTVGGLSGIHSLRIHQIEPFTGETDRVVVTFHLGFIDGQWTIWF